MLVHDWLRRRRVDARGLPGAQGARLGGRNAMSMNCTRVHKLSGEGCCLLPGHAGECEWSMSPGRREADPPDLHTAAAARIAELERDLAREKQESIDFA